MRALIFFFVFLLSIPCLTQAETETLEKVSLQLQWKHQFEFAGFYAAIEKGFYRDDGLEVEIREFVAGSNPVQEVLDGKADFGISYSTLVADYLQGKPVVLLANIFKHGALVLISQKELTTPPDLIGRTIMKRGSEESLRSSGNTMIFQHYDMSLSDITAVESNNNIDAFINGDIDGALAFITNEPYKLDKKNIEYNIFTPTNYGAHFYDVNILTSKHYLNKHPEQTQAFRRASIKGWEYALAHSDEIVDLILTKYNTQNKSKAALIYEAKVTKDLILPEIYKIGSIDCNVLDEIAENFVNSGKVANDSDFNFSGFLFNQTCSIDDSIKLTLTEKQYLKSKQEIKVCVDPDWMPLESIQGTKHIGMAADYMNIIEDHLQTPIILVPTETWTESLKYVETHKCDILSLAMETSERKKYLNFTQPYLVSPLVIATTTDKIFISELKKVQREKLGIVKGYAHIELLKQQYPLINLIEVASVEEGLESVASGDLFGFIDNLTIIGFQIQKNYIGTLKISGRIGQDFELGIGVRNDDLLLLGILDKAISAIDEKSKQSILNQWISINYQQGFDYALFWKILAVIALFLVFIMNRYQTLKFYNAKLEKLSTTDPLTKLYNRRYLNTNIERAYNLAKRYSTPFSIILMDIDDFKKVNDTQGHDEGDNVLLKVADVLLKQSRKNDIVGRWGGEEFLIICSHSDVNAAKVVAEKICRTIEKELFAQDTPITASFGIAEFQNNENYDRLVINADKALYKAKEMGKNRVVVFH